MTSISFLHGAGDRIQSAAQWLRQAWDRREPVLVYVPDAEQAARLDRVLWTQPALSFVPHCRADAPLADATPILLTGRLDERLDNPAQDSCLLNLSNDLPPTFSRFEQLVEIISIDDADRLPARERFKFYRDRGYAIESRDISGGL
ncbi:MAG: DNA polymerase III subunit chi [Rhodocyclaceae bacterium]|nr:DNA polymerase III subunit chi [Rhodocyclaceae bacterium]